MKARVPAASWSEKTDKGTSEGFIREKTCVEGPRTAEGSYGVGKGLARGTWEKGESKMFRRLVKILITGGSLGHGR